MKLRHLTFLAILVMLGLGTLVPCVSFAQRYPDRPIQLVIPNVPGSSMDLGARMIASELEKSLGTKIIPNNRPGAGTVMGTDLVVRSKKDGYTLLYGDFSSALIVAPILNPEVVHYDPAKDVEPLGLHFLFPNVFTVRAESPWKTFRELIDYAKKEPRKVRVSTMGVGSLPHFLLEMIQATTGTQFNHVPFEGGESVITAVLGGHVEATFQALVRVKSHVDAGKMRILLTNNKMPAFPEIPTITELGYKQSLPIAGFGLYAPAGIPEEAKSVLVPAIEKAVKNTKPKVDQLFGVIDYKTPSEQRKMWEEEYKKIYEVATKIGLRKP
jgi:tripartite-type tricarboxylate transporter receptor subunit TctC